MRLCTFKKLHKTKFKPENKDNLSKINLVVTKKGYIIEESNQKKIFSFPFLDE